MRISITMQLHMRLYIIAYNQMFYDAIILLLHRKTFGSNSLYICLTEIESSCAHLFATSICEFFS